MAEKKFAQMTTKKLEALLATASDEDRVKIEEVLAARQALNEKPAVQKPYEAEEEEPLTEEEKAALKAAEENGGINPMYNGRETKAAKLTDEERAALAASLKDNVNHKCQAVPFNTAEWVDGYIAGVIEDKRTNKVLYAIKTIDGRRIVKVHDSNLLKIFDETVEPEKKVRTRKSKEATEKSEWTDEMIASEINEVIGNVGKLVDIEKYRTTDENGKEHVESITGRIVAIVPDKRAQRLLYRISVPTPVEGNPHATRIMHKVVKAEGIVITSEFDEEGAQINEKYISRRESTSTRTALTPQEKVVRCKENLMKAEEKLKKAQEDLNNKKMQYEAAMAELDAFNNSSAENAESEEESLA